MANKLVSVCINAYNAEKFILKTVESVLNQTYKNLQVIIVDDCSTDNTYDLVKSISDDRVEIYKTALNGHMSFACNEALRHVKGDYVAHLDADDLWVENKIEKQVAFLEQNPEYAACFTYAEIIDENGDVCDESYDDFRKLFVFENRSRAQMYRFLFDNSNKLCHCSALVKTDIVKKVGAYDNTILYLQDYDYWMRLLTISSIYILPERLTLVRRHSTNNSNMNDEKWSAYRNESIRIIYKSINLCPDDLFLEAFADKLKIQGLHTNEEVELEKALLLLEGSPVFKENPVLGLYKFAELFKEEDYIKLAEQKFGFSTRDLYKIQQSKCYIDIGEYKHLVGTVNNLDSQLNIEKNLNKQTTEELERCKKYINDLEVVRDSSNSHISNLENYIKQLEGYVRELENRVNLLNDNINEITNSFFWKITKPFRKIKSLFNK